MKLTDYVVRSLAQQGIDTVFGLTGGAVVHLFDSADRNPDIKVVFCHHEQAAAFAAQAYARIRNAPGAAFVTTGPGGTNALTGVAAAWLDSVPCIFISGQARLSHTTRYKKIRQLGIQQMDILNLVAPITKFSVMLEDPLSIKYNLQKAIHIARSGRPGPVWLDLPMDIQWASVEPESLPSFDPSEMEESSPASPIDAGVRRCFEMIAAAERPVFLAGYGVRLAHAENEFRHVVERLRIPFLSTWNASDLLPTNHPLYVGRPGVFGQRGANLAIQNCDLLLSVGSHLCLSLTGTLFEAFAREANIVMVDADQDELSHRTVRVDLPIRCDAKEFLRGLSRLTEGIAPPEISPWREQCTLYQTRHNAVPQEWRNQENLVNPYVFMDTLSGEMTGQDQVVIDGGGTVNQISFQSLKIKQGQRVIISSGICSMGSGLPESVGACFAGNRRRTICLTGDGSMQLNVQELQTIVHHNLPVKIFVFNNRGYLSIRNTQDGFLGGNHAGSSTKGGLTLPDFVKVAEAYGLKAGRARNHRELKQTIQSVLASDGPALCEVLVSEKQQIEPRQAFEKNADGTFVPRPLEDMEPLLSSEEYLESMMIQPWKDSPSRRADFESRPLQAVT